MGVTQNRAAIISLLRTRQRGTGAVEDYIAQMDALGESLRPQTIAAMRVFDDYVAVNNLRSFITLALPLASDNFLGFEAALYRPPGFVGIVNNGFTGAAYSRTTGLTANGTSWINTGLQSSAVAGLGTGMLGVTITSSAVDVGADLGVWDGTPSGNFNLYSRWTNDNCYAEHYQDGTAFFLPGTAAGFTLMNRLSSTDFKVWKDGAQVASSAVLNTGNLPATTIGLCCTRNSSTGLPADITNGRVYTGFIIGAGMPDAAIPGFMSAWQTMQAAIRA
jgi:hypothetical protein